MPARPTDFLNPIDDQSTRTIDRVARRNAADLSYSDLKELVQSLGQPAYRVQQFLDWVYKDLATSFDEMTNLPRSVRQALSREVSLPVLEVVDERISGDKTTRKVLFELNDSHTVEAVLMTYRGPRSSRERTTVCLSTQVGCPIGCPFCATGQQGFERNLSAGEMVAQVLHFRRLLAATSHLDGRREPLQGRGGLTNVVFMGMGEPLANYDSVVKCIGVLNSSHGLAIGRRQITISTVGLVPQMRQLAGEKLPVELAVSLHAATDEIRDRLVPINKKYPLAELLAACVYYFRKTGRQPSFEYALFAGINDSVSDARRLAKLLEEHGGHVNLIPGNTTQDKKFRPSSGRAMASFQKELNASGISNTLRLYRGLDIEAGCGQLRSRRMSSEAT